MAEATHEPAAPRMILAAGSYDLEDLEKAAAATMKAKPEDRELELRKQLTKVRKAEYDPAAPGMLPGHEVIQVERTLVEGHEVPKEGGKKGETETVGAVVVTENVQVFKKSKAKEEEAAAEEATVAGEGQILSGAPGAAESDEG
jgi:hypothetical protein